MGEHGDAEDKLLVKWNVTDKRLLSVVVLRPSAATLKREWAKPIVSIDEEWTWEASNTSGPSSGVFNFRLHLPKTNPLAAEMPINPQRFGTKDKACLMFRLAEVPVLMWRCYVPRGYRMRVELVGCHPFLVWHHTGTSHFYIYSEESVWNLMVHASKTPGASDKTMARLTLLNNCPKEWVDDGERHSVISLHDGDVIAVGTLEKLLPAMCVYVSEPKPWDKMGQ